MAYQALYRKWRPLVFSDVFSQEHVTESLKQQVASAHLSHAYLFTGTRGTGKTTCAKILSRAVNCENPKNGDPCNECLSCKGILSGSIMDVLEIDAASNNGVDNIRDIRDEVIYSPASVKKRVYIIDEVHMLSTGAFNALLKTLEEPPEHVLFILATTEVQKVPATILSRCQRFDFVRVRPEDIANRLQTIANGEKITVERDVLMKIARFADGSLRDAISIFDRCISGLDCLTMEKLSSILGFADGDSIIKLMYDINAGDIPSVLSSFSALYAEGVSISSLFDELLLLIRDLLIIKMASKKASSLLSPSHDYSELAPLAERFETQTLTSMSDVISEVLVRMQRTRSRRTEAEMCLIKLCTASSEEYAEPTPAIQKKSNRLPVSPPAQKSETPIAPNRTEPAPASSSAGDRNVSAPGFEKPAVASSPDWGLLLSKLAGKVAPSVFALLNLSEAEFEDRKIKIIAEQGAVDHLNVAKVKAAVASAAKEQFSVDYLVEVSALENVKPKDPCLELIKNARLGGVDIEFN